jgi:integrase
MDMAKLGKLTDASVKSAPTPSPDLRRPYEIYYDAELKGFGLRVTKAGARSFILNYRARGIERRYTIGSFPDWSVRAAREEAKHLKRQIDRGQDPMSERHEQRTAPTVNDLVVRYLSDHALRKRERSRREDEGLIAQWIKPELGNRKVFDIRHADIEKLHRKVTDNGTPIRANRLVALLSKIFNLAIRWEMRGNNPAKGIERNPENERNRFLNGDELWRLTDALAACPNRPAANAIKLLILTGARRGEVLAATWDQFNLDEGVWTKPSSHTKQKREHRVPLSAPAGQLLAEMKCNADRYAAENNLGTSRFVFPAQRATRRAGGCMVEIKGPWARIRKAAQLNGVRIHDLRHTYASMLASAGQSLPIIGGLLGHTQPGTTARYAHLLDDPLRAATERVGVTVTRDGGKPGAEVIEAWRR